MFKLMGKNLTEHFAVTENLHTAVLLVKTKRKVEINELVTETLLKDDDIRAEYNKLVKEGQ